MSNGDLGWITNFIWGIADDVLRDLYVRGKYRDVILPMTVLRRLDAMLGMYHRILMNRGGAWLRSAMNSTGIPPRR
jgi:type I restriction-modification system DNA methylase subunit